jgi:hypothetical protein
MLLALAASPAALGAQPIVPMLDGAEVAAALAESRGNPAEARSCLDWPADGRPTIATVLAERAGAPWEVDIDERAWPSLIQFTERVAASMRARLGAQPGRLASPPDSVFNWRQLGGHLHLVAYRTGILLWWPAGSTPFHSPMRDSGSVVGEQMLADAVEAAFQAGGGLAWPDSVKGDSIAFKLRFAWPLPRRDTAGLEPIAARHAAPIAPLLVPIVSEVEQVQESRIRYPRVAQDEGFQALIRLQYTVTRRGASCAGASAISGIRPLRDRRADRSASIGSS